MLGGTPGDYSSADEQDGRRACGSATRVARDAAKGLSGAAQLAEPLAIATPGGGLYALAAGCMPTHFCELSCGAFPQPAGVAA